MQARVVVLAGMLLLTACGKPEATPAQKAATAAAMRPADVRLAGLYDQSCRVCHTDPATGAPLAGDTEAWAPRLKQGDAALLANVIASKNAMPAGGQCFACTAADYKALIGFMAGTAK